MQIPEYLWEAPVREEEARALLRPNALRRAWQSIAPRLNLVQRTRSLEGDRRGNRLQRLVLPNALVRGVISSRPPTPGDLRFLVDGYSLHVEAIRGDALSTTTNLEDIGRRFPYPLTQEETLAQVRTTITRLRLCRRVPGSGSEPYRLEFVGVLHRPYWVLYYQRYDGRVDFRMLDAVTGRRTGSLTRRSLLGALATWERYEACPDGSAPCAPSIPPAT
jgi:hypothetical protein